jgi:hypothetical protein
VCAGIMPPWTSDTCEWSCWRSLAGKSTRNVSPPRSRSEAARARLGAPGRSPVRLTDLRLATAPEMADSKELKLVLRPLFDSLERPITLGGVQKWKWDRLWVAEGARGRWSEGRRDDHRKGLLRGGRLVALPGLPYAERRRGEFVEARGTCG